MENFWVGNIGKIIFVFDPEIQINESDSVILFSLTHEQPVKLKKEAVKQNISSLQAGERYELAQKAYRKWKRFYRSQLKTIEAQPALNTKRFIEKTQKIILYSETGRVTNCYNCKRELSSTQGNICSKCLWIICKCGACGCKWEK